MARLEPEICSRTCGKPEFVHAKPRSLKIEQWPPSDQAGWAQALRPSERLKRGGAGARLAKVSRDDYANRYGLYLDFLHRTGRLDMAESAATLVTQDNVAKFVRELQARVRSGTVLNSVSKLSRAARLIAPQTDFSWLIEIEKDLALVVIPRSKAGRLVLTERLVEAGLTLIQEAEMFGKTPRAKALGARNGLMIALLALHPVRIKNFAALSIGDTFVQINGRWWLQIPSDDTKTGGIDQRQVPDFITEVLKRYLQVHRQVLCRGKADQTALWTSSTTGKQLTTKNLGTLISRITRETVGVDVSPHLFRTAGASTAAIYGGEHPNLASGLLNHRDRRIVEEHYDRSMGLTAGEEYGGIARLYRQK